MDAAEVLGQPAHLRVDEGRWVHVAEYAPPKTVDARKSEQRLLDLVECIPEVLGVKREEVFLKTRRRQEGNAQYEKLDATGELLAARGYSSVRSVQPTSTAFSPFAGGRRELLPHQLPWPNQYPIGLNGTTTPR